MARVFSLPLFILLCCANPAISAQQPIIVGVVTDGPSLQIERAIKQINQEIQQLVEGEFTVRLPKSKQLNGGWQRAGIESSLTRLYADKGVDIVLALGFASATVAATRKNHPKPTLAAMVMDDRLIDAPRKGDVSGKHNLTYISIQADLNTELAEFRKVTDFKNVALLSDALMSEVMPSLHEKGEKIARKFDIQLTPVAHRGGNDDLLSRLPAGVDAVLIGALPRMSISQQKALLNGLTDLGLPTYSLMGSQLVEQGALVTALPAQNWQRRSRRLALNLQAVLLGNDLADMRVFIEGKRRLVINMETARRLKISPPLEIMLDAKVLHYETRSTEFHWTLEQVVEQVVAENLGIRASLLGVDSGAERVAEARSRLLPQLSVELNQQLNNSDSPAVSSGALAEELGVASIRLSQIIYDEPSNAGLATEKAEQLARIADNQTTELDIVRNATVAFLTVFQSQAQRDIRYQRVELTRTNLQLAHDRVKSGSATNSDLYRWQSELAQAKAALLRANSSYKQSRESLNRLLNRPLNEPFSLQPVTLVDSILTLNDPVLTDLLGNDLYFQRLSEAFIHFGLNNSPLVAASLARITAQERILESERSSYWSPTVSLSGELSHAYQDSRTNAFSTKGEEDWRVGLNLSLPLFEGGGRSSRVQRALLTRNQLQLELEDTRRSIEQHIRSDLHIAQASRFSIDLNSTATEAAQKNLGLISDAYSKGSSGIINLIDAQNSAITAQLNEANAAYQYLVDLANLQYSLGGFDYFLEGAQRRSTIQIIKNAVISGD
ncbi:MAG: TolC family protein [Pseudomonadales bacterium]|nr:TolC family protein [Pseudomonadales bacterium]